jgi:hypothetical protein
VAEIKAMVNTVDKPYSGKANQAKTCAMREDSHASIYLRV